MKKQILAGILILFLATLACSIQLPTAVPPASEEPGSTEVPVTPPPVAAATLKVAYVKEGNIWLWSEGLGSSQLTIYGTDYYPVLSGDGQVVAFLRDEILWAVNADGTNERVLVSREFLDTVPAVSEGRVDVDEFVWYPNRHALFFNTRLTVAESGYGQTQTDLWYVDADNTSNPPVMYEAIGSGGIPTISPDGQMIAMAQANQIITVGITGAIPWRVALSFTPVSTYSEWTYYPRLTWLPDSSAVRVVIPAPDPLGDPSGKTVLWNVPWDGTEATPLVSFPAIPVFEGNMSISPDGNNVLYLALINGYHCVAVAAVSQPGIEDYVFYNPGSVDVIGWAPDSLRFVYWGDSIQASYVGQVDSPAYTIGDSGTAYSISWVDNNRLLYFNEANELRLWLYGGVSTLVDTAVSQYNFIP